MRASRFVRRAQLAYRLLREYEEEQAREPFDCQRALEVITAYAGDRYGRGIEHGLGARQWRDAVERVLSLYPTQDAS